jgi:solute carrier family 25 oxoglutarate transporter 11
MSATALTSPFDVLKIRRQMYGELESKASASMMQTVQGILRQEGIGGFYRGLPAALFRQSIYSTARFGAFDALGKAFPDATGPLVKIPMGLAAGALGALLSSPADLVMLRMQADGRLPLEARRNYNNPFQALHRIVTTEGVTALWKGAGPNINRAMVVTTSQLVSYSTAQDYIATNPYYRIRKDHWVTTLLASLAAGLVTAVCASPADVVRSRIMNAGVMERLAFYAPGSIDCYGYTPKMASYTGTLDCVQQIIRTEGPHGLYKGFIAYYMRVGPYVMSMFICKEQFDRFLDGMRDKDEV